ncbi:MAG: D-alanyl-D-alanine-carboxypeptidase/D-alanyl-D-alanine-endopeptidase [Polaribacter sp.]|jgi:D-alanyl-D-alanine-carboxypeptidase/D-alanyl-D-alanine-endopeptidase
MKLPLIGLLVFLFSFSVFAQDKSQLKEEIAKVVHFDTEISHERIPGYVIGIIVGDSVFTYGFGQKAKEVEEVPDENTLFEIGSVTKVFTSSLLGVLSDEGLMSHEAPLNDYLPKKYRNSKLQNVTISSLLTHTSGLPKMPTPFGIYEEETDNPYAHYSKELLLEFYADFEPVHRQQTTKKKRRKKLKEAEVKAPVEYIYSHLNYALLEVAMENITGQSYDELLDERIFSQVGMPQSFANFAAEEQANLLTAGYGRNGSEAKPWTFASFSASQGMKSTTQDLLSFLKVHINEPTTPLAISFRNNTIPAVNTGLTENGAMGFGWHILHQKKYYDIHLHAGSTGGHRAFIGFIRETRTGVVVLSNSENGTGGLGYLLLRLINFNWKKGKSFVE